MIDDSELDNLIEEEKNRQIENIELIASENFTSSNVLRCLGSILTNKYRKDALINVIMVGTRLLIK